MILDCRPKNEFISLESVYVPNTFSVTEAIANVKSVKPIFLIFTEGNSVMSKGIKFFTHSDVTHTSISFDSAMTQVFSYNIKGKYIGMIKETMASFKDNRIHVFAFFANNDVVHKMREYVSDFEKHKTHYDVQIIINKMLNIDIKPTQDKYRQVCSSFVDSILKAVNIDISGGKMIPAPSDLFNEAKSKINKIFEVYDGKATHYNHKLVNRKLMYIATREESEVI